MADNPQMAHSAENHPWATIVEPSTCGTQHGIEGALLAGPDGPTSVTWLQGPYELIVIGPARTLSPDTAVAIARNVAEKFAPTAASG